MVRMGMKQLIRMARQEIYEDMRLHFMGLGNSGSRLTTIRK
jgi:hypothetical protein